MVTPPSLSLTPTNPIPLKSQEALVLKQLADKRERVQEALHKVREESNIFSKKTEEKLIQKMEVNKENREAHLNALKQRLREKASLLLCLWLLMFCYQSNKSSILFTSKVCVLFIRSQATQNITWLSGFTKWQARIQKTAQVQKQGLIRRRGQTRWSISIASKFKRSRQKGKSKVQKHRSTLKRSGSESEWQNAGELGEHTRQSGKEWREKEQYIYWRAD